MGLGYQGPSDGVVDKFIPCFCRTLSIEELDVLKEKSGSTTVTCDDWNGHEYIDAH